MTTFFCYPLVHPALSSDMALPRFASVSVRFARVAHNPSVSCAGQLRWVAADRSSSPPPPRPSVGGAIARGAGVAAGWTGFGVLGSSSVVAGLGHLELVHYPGSVTIAAGAAAVAGFGLAGAARGLRAALRCP